MKYQQSFRIVTIGFFTGLISLWVSNSSAQTEVVTGWGYDQGATAGSASTVTDEGGGSFTATTPSGSSAIRADLSSPISFDTVGDSVELSGEVAMTSPWGNQQFRFGLLDDNGNGLGSLSSGVWTGDTATGWLGYMVEAGNASTPNTSQVLERGGGASGAWDSGTGGTGAGAPATYSGAWGTTTSGTGTFNFDLTLTLATSTSIDVSYDIIQTGGTGVPDDYVASGSFVDSISGTATAGDLSFDAVGFLLTGSSGGAASFSDIEVISPVPEPSTMALSGVGGIMASIFMLRRKK